MSEIAKALGVDLMDALPCVCGSTNLPCVKKPHTCATQVICQKCDARGPEGAYNIGAIQQWNRLRGQP